MFESDGVVYTWRQRGSPDRPHNIKPTVKHGGGSLMVWSCMTSKGVGYATAILEGTMDSKAYTDILGSAYKDTLDYYGLQRDKVLFQHDNDSKHTSQHTKKWLERENIRYISD